MYAGRGRIPSGSENDSRRFQNNFPNSDHHKRDSFSSGHFNEGKPFQGQFANGYVDETRPYQGQFLPQPQIFTQFPSGPVGATNLQSNLRPTSVFGTRTACTPQRPQFQSPTTTANVPQRQRTPDPPVFTSDFSKIKIPEAVPDNVGQQTRTNIIEISTTFCENLEKLPQDKLVDELDKVFNEIEKSGKEITVLEERLKGEKQVKEKLENRKTKIMALLKNKSPYKSNKPGSSSTSTNKYVKPQSENTTPSNQSSSTLKPGNLPSSELSKKYPNHNKPPLKKLKKTEASNKLSSPEVHSCGVKSTKPQPLGNSTTPKKTSLQTTTIIPASLEDDSEKSEKTTPDDNSSNANSSDANDNQATVGSPVTNNTPVKIKKEKISDDAIDNVSVPTIKIEPGLIKKEIKTEKIKVEKIKKEKMEEEQSS